MALLAWRANGPVCNGFLPLTAVSRHLKPTEKFKHSFLRLIRMILY